MNNFEPTDNRWQSYEIKSVVINFIAQSKTASLSDRRLDVLMTPEEAIKVLEEHLKGKNKL